ncbi:cytochrome c3 family protein [Novosphingobium flavum]|uniref:Cytochrome c3 family protein n=1 Tax=Novosphingobium flavum TaxID=1778672 RepID=A0A7X1FNI0_9SPHN|nr:cytochrome c3 family protein [Novosphingobium flavum]MBC2664084.1 cytochrome c3 family protein [Novosphingobium flavum]
MTFRLRTVSTTADGRRIVRDKVLDKAALTVGRLAENDIHLPDLAVEPSHARISLLPASRVAVEATGTLGFAVDGQTTRTASIDARTGAELRFGSTRIVIGEEEGAVLLTVEPVPDRSDVDPEKDGLALSAVLPGKRRLAWIFAALILALFLALPVASNLMRAPDLKQSKVVGDGAWTPGALSLAHHQLEGKCEACHVKPFEAVRNETCLSCHKSVHDHAPEARIALARAVPGLGGQILGSVAHAFGKEGSDSCVECHREHEGMTKMAAPAQQFCADCHGSLKDRLSDTKLGNAADFGTLHPEFAPAVVVDPANRTTRRVSLDQDPHENSGLAFPHKLHLDPRGGVAKMAATLAGDRGYGSKGLGCGDCHRPSEDGTRFKPITMERDCEACHSLVYDKFGTTFRKLRHGDVDQAIADLSVAGNTTQPLVTGRGRPGAYGADQLYFARFTRPVGGGLVAGMLGKDGVCGECHTATVKNGHPAVMPVTLPQRYMDKGWFDHSAHRQTPCAECHAAPGSSSSRDVLLPKLAECRECHVGDQAAGLFRPKDKVPSSCAMCHAYHPTGAAPMAARRVKR